MPTVIVASAATRQSWIVNSEWSLASGPLQGAIAHYLVTQGIHDFLIIARGILAGRWMVGSAVATLTAVSPQSGGVVESKIEGPLAHGLSSLGVSAIVVIGTSTQPSGLVIEGSVPHTSITWVDSVAAPQATVWETDALVRLSPDDTVVTTGKWGMAKHKAASIVTNQGYPSAQGGLGAVMGEMNIKYIHCHSGEPAGKSTASEKTLTEEYVSRIDSNPLTQSERDYPGFALWPTAALHGYVASGGFSSNPSAGLTDFSAENFLPFAVDNGESACPACPQSCLKAFSADPAQPLDGGRAHQLGMAAFAIQGDSHDVESVIAFNALCHSIGVEHLFAEEMVRGMGPFTPDTLAEILDQRLGVLNTSPHSALHVKGMALPPFEPRSNQGLAVGWALNPGGPRYDVLEHDIDFDRDFVSDERAARGEDFGLPAEGLPLGTLDERRHQSIVELWLCWSALDALGICEYAAPPTRELTVEGICSLVAERTDAPFTTEDLYQLGLTRLGLLKDINDRLGVSEALDTLPDVFFDVALATGHCDGVAINRDEFEAALGYVRESFEWKDGGLNHTGSVFARVTAAHRAAGRIFEEVRL